MKCSQIPYKRFELTELKQAYEKFEKRYYSATSCQDVLSAREEFLDVVDHYSTASSLAQTRYSLNSYDEFYKEENDYYDQVSPFASEYITNYCKLILSSPFIEELKKALPKTLFKNYECEIKSHSPLITDLEIEENGLVTKYSELMSKLTTDFRGEKRTISYIRGFMEDSDQKVRKEACYAIGNALKSVSGELDDIFDKLVKVRTQMAQKLGYKNFIELGYQRMQRIDYNQDMVKVFRQNVLEDIVPVVAKIKNDIKNGLKLDKFYFYDNEITLAKNAPVPMVNDEKLLKVALDMYQDMSNVTGEFMKEMLDAEAFDVEARDGKWGGGFCTDFVDYKQPFILANFNGTSADVDVVTHEFGHALASKLGYDYGEREVGIGSMETAETHSMSMEFFAYKYMDKFFAEPNEYKIKHLISALSFIPYGVIVDEFQHIVYENPDLTPSERNKAYLNLEKKYRPYLTFEDIPYLQNGTRWQYQMHIYESPFYYIDYCLAQVVAFEFLALSQENYQEGLNRYFDHLKRGGKYPFSELVSLAHLNSPFKQGALKEISKSVLKLYEKLNNNK